MNLRPLLKKTLLAALTSATLLTLSHKTQAQQLQATQSPVRDAAHSFRKGPLSWTELKKRNVVMQRRDFSCGAAALATFFQFHLGKYVTEQHLLEDADRMLSREEIVDRLQNGITMTDLKNLADRHEGYSTRMGRLTLQDLAESKTPIIVGLIVNEYDHFAVYRGLDGRYVYLADPARGNLRVPIGEFLDQWQRNLGLVVFKTDDPLVENSRLTVRPDEIFLGELNRWYIRDRITTIHSASGN